MAAVSTFGSFLQSLQQVDFFTLLLPFVVSYIVFLFALREVDLFEDNQQVPAVIALAASFFVAQFIAMNPFYQTFFLDFFGRLTIGMIGLLGLMIVLGMSGFGGYMDSRWLGIILVVSIAIIFTRAGGLNAILPLEQFPSLQTLFNLLFQTGLVWIIIVGALIYSTASGGDGGIFGE